MVDSIKASEQGLRIVDQARQKKRWNKTAEAWCIRGFTSRATLSRFWAGQSIRKEIFIAICEAVGANWQEVADWGETYSVALVKSEVETSDSLTPDPSAGEGRETNCAVHPDDRQDWGDAPEAHTFYGRTNELINLNHWIGPEKCRLVALLGMGGVGKTALVAKFARSHHQEFEFIIWRNLRNAPPLEELLAELLQFLSESQEIDRPTPLDGKILQLLKCLRDHRCLLILDGVESILQNGSETHVGGYRAGYEGYGQLLTCIGETQHQSCLVLTSREMPKGLSTLEGEALPVRCLPLKGVTWIEGQQIAQTKGAFTGSEGEWAAFVERYAGNPLVLKIVASTIRAMFGSSIAYFLTLLENSAFLIDEVRDLLEEQFNRLGRLEQDLLHWLAINDKPMTVEELQEGVSYPLSISELMQTIAALQRRSLIEITIEQTTYATQPSIVLRYATNSLIEQISWGMNQQHEIINKPKQYESADTKQLTDPSHKNNKVHSVHTISPQPQFSTANELLTPARV